MREIKKTYYMYQGMPLKVYCHVNGLSYQTIRECVAYKDMSIEEAVARNKEFRHNKRGVKAKFLYKGKSLLSFLNHNQYGMVYNRMMKKGYTIEQAVEDVLNNTQKFRRKYLIKGKSLYSLMTGSDYAKFMSYLHRHPQEDWKQVYKWYFHDKYGVAE